MQSVRANGQDMTLQDGKIHLCYVNVSQCMQQEKVPQHIFGTTATVVAFDQVLDEGMSWMPTSVKALR